MLDNVLDYRMMLNIHRMGGKYTHRDYNLMEHSYMTAMLFMYFAKKEGITYSVKVLDAILHHDAVEIITGDLIHPVKNFNNETVKAWETIENQITMNLPDYKQYTDANLDKLFDEDQYWLFKACDTLDLYIFCYEEYVLGNRHKELLEVLGRCKKLLANYDIKFKSINEFLKQLKYE